MEQLFTPDFSQPNTAPSNGHEHASSVGDDVPHIDDQQAASTADVADHLNGPNVDQSDQDQALRGKAATHGLTIEEKKERQKQQNRRAAERSRNKKREELTALEMTVNNIQDENQRLRTRLSSLLASKSEDAPQVPTDVEAAGHSNPGGIDYANLAKLQSELASAKATLLEREMELARVQGEEPTGDNDDVRRLLLTHATSLQTAQSEVKVLHSAISHIRMERDNLARQRDILTREVEARRSLQDATNGSPPTSATATGVERALLELRGLVDNTIKSWEQGSILQTRSFNSGEGDR